MLKIIGNDILRSGQKVGYIEGSRIRSHEGKMLGYFSGSHVYNAEGHKVAYIEGDHLCPEDDRDTEIHLDKVNENVVGEVLPEICRCAIYCLIGV